jgi:uncharacterized protein DUF3560
VITISHTHADGTVLSGSRKGDGVYDIVKAHGFRYSPQVGIYIRGSRDRDAQRWRIDAAATALREAGHEVTVEVDDQWRPAAEREAARTERADDRAERLDERADKAAERRDARQAAADRTLDAIPFGQPMMPGHHSYKADRNRRERAWNNMDKALTEDRKATHLAERADGVRGNDAAKDNPRAIMRRIERLKADLRRFERELAAAQEAKASDSYQQRLRRDIDRLIEDISHQQSKLTDRAETGAFVAWGPDNLAKDDRVRVRHFGWYRVTRVNRLSVSLDNDRWPQRITFDQIFGRRRGDLQYDTPNGQPWPVALAIKVARWQGLVRAASTRSYEPQQQRQARHVGYARRLVHGLPLGASDAEVDAFWPTDPGTPDDDRETLDLQRELAAAYLAVYERLEAGELVPAIVASLTPHPGAAGWRMPAGDPVDRHPQDLHEGDIVAGVWQNGGLGGRELWPHFAGPVAHVGPVADRRERGDWVSVTLTDGTVHEFKTHLWLAVHCRHEQPAAAGQQQP